MVDLFDVEWRDVGRNKTRTVRFIPLWQVHELLAQLQLGQSMRVERSTTMQPLQPRENAKPNSRYL